jgi:hypothetical protein
LLGEIGPAARGEIPRSALDFKIEQLHIRNNPIRQAPRSTPTIRALPRFRHFNFFFEICFH